ncbi:MAG: helical backbone metal receptor [Saccharofermentans sp.]|nr:helical backbone metal receptor [Saccharofermentans sp.]
MKKKVMSVVLAASFLFGMAACSKDDKTTESSEAAETTVAAAEETKAEETEAPAETAAVDTASDLRVVSLSPEVTEIIFALGAEDVLVGRSTYCDYPADVSSIPAVGDLYAMDVEAIVAVEPTVVLASSFVDDDTVAALAEYGIEVAVVTEGTDIEGLYALINEVATYVDAEDEAAALNDEISAELAAIETIETDSTVYYVVGYGEYGDFTAGDGSFIASIIETAGAKNAGEGMDQWAMLDAETLIALDPDYIVIADYLVDDFTNMEPYSALTAVSEGRVIAVDENVFVRQTPRNVEAVKALVAAIAEYEAA